MFKKPRQNLAWISWIEEQDEFRGDKFSRIYKKTLEI